MLFFSVFILASSMKFSSWNKTKPHSRRTEKQNHFYNQSFLNDNVDGQYMPRHTDHKYICDMKEVLKFCIVFPPADCCLRLLPPGSPLLIYSASDNIAFLKKNKNPQTADRLSKEVRKRLIIDKTFSVFCSTVGTNAGSFSISFWTQFSFLKGGLEKYLKEAPTSGPHQRPCINSAVTDKRADPLVNG